MREIARELEVSPTTVLRWTDPEQARRERESSRRAKTDRRVRCERCARRLSYERSGGLCRQCLNGDARSLISDRVVSLYSEGQDAAQIARRVKRSDSHIRTTIARLAREGRIDLRHPSRSAKDVRARERRILRLRASGHSRREIARRVGLTDGSVGVVLVRLRRRGLVPAPARSSVQARSLSG